MVLTIFIFLLVLILLIFSIKIFSLTNNEKVTAKKRFVVLQNQVQEEFVKQKIIDQKLYLVNELNNSLKVRLYKIVEDVILLQNKIFNNQFS